jgi:hypothetical protein
MNEARAAVPHTAGMPRRLQVSHRAVARAAAVALGIGVAGALIVGLGWAVYRECADLGHCGVPDAAVDAAVDQYKRSTGVATIDVGVAVGWQDCVVVDLRVPNSDVATVVMTSAGGRWRLATAEPDISDTDDVIDRQHCLDLAKGIPTP